MLNWEPVIFFINDVIFSGSVTTIEDWIQSLLNIPKPPGKVTNKIFYVDNIYPQNPSK